MDSGFLVCFADYFGNYDDGVRTTVNSQGFSAC